MTWIRSLRESMALVVAAQQTAAGVWFWEFIIEFCAVLASRNGSSDIYSESSGRLFPSVASGNPGEYV